MGQVFRNCILPAQRSYLKKTNVFRKANSFFLFSDFKRKVFGLSARKRSACLSKLNSIPSQKNFLRERKSNIFLFVFFRDFGRKFFEILANYLAQPCRNCLVSVQRNHLGRKVFDNFFSSVMMNRKTLHFGQKKTAALLKTHSISPQKPFEGRSWHVLVFFGARTDFLQIPSRNVGQVCQNWIVAGQRRLLQKTSVSGKANSLSCFWFWIFSVRSLVYLQKNIGNLSFVKSEVHPFIGLIWGGKAEKFLVRFFRFPAETTQNSS